MGDAEDVLSGADPTQPTPPPPDNSTIPTQPTPTYTQPTVQAPQQAGTDPVLQAAAVHHSRIANAINAVGDILGGNKTLHLQQNPDGSVSVTQVDATPGQKWGRVAQAALAGAAKGFAVGQGPGGAQRAAAAGIQTGMALPQAQQDQTLALADRENDQNRQKQLFNANIAYLNQRNLQQSWQLGEDKKMASEHDEDRDMQFNSAVKQLHMIDVGPATDVEEAAKTYNTNTAVQQAMTGQSGQLVIHHSATGPPHAWIIPEDQMSKLNPEDQKGYHYNLDPTTNAVTKTAYDIAPNTEDGQHTAFRIANENNELLNAIKVGIQGKAETAKANAVKPPNYVLGEDKQGNPAFYDPRNPTAAPIPAGVQRSGTAARSEAQTGKLEAAQEKQLGPARDAMNFANDYLNRGVYTGASDEALQEKFFELAKPSSGFKMTKPQQDMLQNSQDAINSITAKAQHAFTPNAPWFSTKLRQDIVNTMRSLAASHPGLTMDQTGRVSLKPITAQTPAQTDWIDNPTGTQGLPTPAASPRPAAQPEPPAPPAPTGATQVFRDKTTGAVRGWAVNGQYVPVTPRTQ